MVESGIFINLLLNDDIFICLIFLFLIKMNTCNVAKTYFKHDQLAQHDKNKKELMLQSFRVVRSIIVINW